MSLTSTQILDFLTPNEKKKFIIDRYYLQKRYQNDHFVQLYILPFRAANFLPHSPHYITPSPFQRYRCHFIYPLLVGYQHEAEINSSAEPSIFIIPR